MSNGLLPGSADHRYMASCGFQSDALHSGNDRHAAGRLHCHAHASRKQRLRCSSLNDGHRDCQVRQSPRRSIQTGDALLNAHLIDPMGFTDGFHWNPDLQLPIEWLDHSTPYNRSKLRSARWNEFLENERSYHRGDLEPGETGNGMGHTEHRSKQRQCGILVCNE